MWSVFFVIKLIKLHYIKNRWAIKQIKSSSPSQGPSVNATLHGRQRDDASTMAMTPASLQGHQRRRNNASTIVRTPSQGREHNFKNARTNTRTPSPLQGRQCRHKDASTIAMTLAPMQGRQQYCKVISVKAKMACQGPLRNRHYKDTSAIMSIIK